MARSRIRTSLAALAAATVLVSVGCGVDAKDAASEKITGTENGGPGKTENTGGDIKIESGSFEGTGGAVFLNRAAVATSEVETQKMWMEMKMSSPATGDISIIAEGSIDNETGMSQITMDMSDVFSSMDSGGGMSLPPEAGIMEMITDGDDTYMKSPLLSMFGDSEKPWVRMDTDEVSDGEVTSGAPSDPTKFLEFLENTGSEIEELGNEEVRGVDTIHVRTTLDMEEIMKSAPAEDQEEMQKQLDEMGGAFTEIPLEAWVDEDGMVRRIQMDFDLADLGDEEMGEGTMLLTIEMYDFGEPVDITIPDPSEVSEMDTAMLPED